MCGIAGFLVEDGGLRPADIEPLARSMGARLAHRGPDADGLWIDVRHGVALAHRRLSIQDLSEAGAQPMRSRCGRYTLVYNGEIYNASELRNDLEARGRRFRGHSDTEVLVAAIAEWGLDQALRHSVGMFALGLWDGERRELSLARDRLGIKPMYWSWTGGRLVFASEIKALLPGLPQRPSIDPAELGSFLHNGCVLAPHTIYSGVEKLMPGTTVRLRPGQPPKVSTFSVPASARSSSSNCSVNRRRIA